MTPGATTRCRPWPSASWITVMAYGDPRQLQYAAANFRDVLLAIVKAAKAAIGPAASRAPALRHQDEEEQ